MCGGTLTPTPPEFSRIREGAYWSSDWSSCDNRYLDTSDFPTYVFSMQANRARRVISLIVALAFVIALGVQHAYVAAVQADTSAAAAAKGSPATDCEQCGESGDMGALPCQPLCVPAVAVIDASAPQILPDAAAFRARAADRAVDRRIRPPPHPPKTSRF